PPRQRGRSGPPLQGAAAWPPRLVPMSRAGRSQTMDKKNRKAIIAGNWKMNKTATEAGLLLDDLIPLVEYAGCEVVVCVPFTDLKTAVDKCAGTNLHVGAQNVHFEKSGAYTGEISADM